MKRIFTILAMLACLNAGAQAYYEFTHSTGTYTELTDPTVLTTTFDEEGWDLDLGTSFKMFGKDFPATSDDTKGWFKVNKFGAVIAVNKTDDKMFAFDGFLVKNFTARDNTSSISYTFVGETGKRVLTVQYKNCGLQGGASSDFVNLQMKFHEDGSQMEVIMGPWQIADVSKVFTFETDKGPSVGIFLSNQAFTVKDEVFFLTGNPASPSASGMPFVSMNGVPAEGKIYTFKHSTTTNPPSLSLLSPIGGEKWKAGESRLIKWKATNVSKIKIEYTHEGFNKYKLVAENVDATTGQYNWVVPNTPANNQCMVKISDMSDPNRYEESAFFFTIEPGAASIGDELLSSRVRAYPNPSNGRFAFTLPEGSYSVNTTLMDATGRVMASPTVQKTGAEYLVDASGIKPGLYILQVATRTETYTVKINIR